MRIYLYNKSITVLIIFLLIGISVIQTINGYESNISTNDNLYNLIQIDDSSIDGYKLGSTTPLNFGEIIFASIGSVAEMDTYTFSAFENDHIILRMGSGCHDFDPEMRLYAPDGSLFEFESVSSTWDHGVCIEIESIVDQNGTYTLLCGDAGGTDLCEYYLFSQRVNNPGLAIPLNFGETLSTSIVSDAEMDTYSFTAVVNDHIILRMGSGCHDFDPEMRLYAPNGSLFEFESASGTWDHNINIEINSDIENAGNYTLLCGDLGGTDLCEYYLFSQVISSNSHINADFQYHPTNPKINEDIHFNDASSSINTNITSWSWDFDDGYTSTLKNPIHHYNQNGTYEVTLNVSDDYGENDSITKQITISNTPMIPYISWYPNAKIPDSTIIMNVTDGVDSYFDIHLTNVPDGYHIKNDTTYNGFCFQKNVSMPRGVDIPVKLCHSFDPDKPSVFNGKNWDEVNYIINSREQYPPQIVQEAVWSIIEDVEPTTSESKDLIQKALIEGSDFTPTHGDYIAVLVYLDTDSGFSLPVQNTYIEVPLNYSAFNASYWNDHHGQWSSDKNMTIGDIFDVTPDHIYGDLSSYNLSEIIIGIQCTGQKQIYARFLQESVTGLLNANDSCVHYPLTYDQIIITVNEAWNAGLLSYGYVWIMYRVFWIYNNII